MGFFHWVRRKAKKAVAPPPPQLPPAPCQVEIPIESLPLEIREAIAAGAKCTFRQFSAKPAGKGKWRAICAILLDGEQVAETEVTWEEAK
jgi:hypothetical protein